MKPAKREIASTPEEHWRLAMTGVPHRNQKTNNAFLPIEKLPQSEYTGIVTNTLEELEGRNRWLSRLVELSVTLNSTLDLDALLQLVTATASELLDCEAASILLYDEKQARLYFAAATGSDPKKLAEIPVPLDHSGVAARRPSPSRTVTTCDLLIFALRKDACHETQ